MTQIKRKKKEKKWQPSSVKKDSSVKHFSHQNTDKMYVSVNLSENIPTTTEKMTHKSSIYLLEMSSHILSFIFETSQYP